MALKFSLQRFTWIILPAFMCIYLFYFTILPLNNTLFKSKPNSSQNSISLLPPCDLFTGAWVFDSNRRSMYDEKCPFHRNAWNCLRNQREGMDRINSWRWVPENCELHRIDPFGFLSLMKNKNIGFIGDSLNENFLVSFLCILRVADSGARKWKRKGAWRGGYFPKYNVTVAYHRAVLLAKFEWQPKKSTEADEDGLKGIYRVDVDIPADDWANVADFYDVLLFNTGHWWNHDKFPKETPLVFYSKGRPINPPLQMLDGFKVVLQNMRSYVENNFPRKKVIKLWRLQSPRHFHGGNWNENGSCLFTKPLEEPQLDLWFDPRNSDGVNKEARQLNKLIEIALQGSDIRLLNLTHLSEYRADAHPAIWLGKKDAVAEWGQDCMHWCLPGLPDVWVDILAQIIQYEFGFGTR